MQLSHALCIGGQGARAISGHEDLFVGSEGVGRPGAELRGSRQTVLETVSERARALSRPSRLERLAHLGGKLEYQTKQRLGGHELVHGSVGCAACGVGERHLTRRGSQGLP